MRSLSVWALKSSRRALLARPAWPRRSKARGFCSGTRGSRQRNSPRTTSDTALRTWSCCSRGLQRASVIGVGNIKGLASKAWFLISCPLRPCSCGSEVLLLLRDNTNNNCNTWGLPGGNCEAGDVSMFQTARREAEEEMGQLPELKFAAAPILTQRGKRQQKHYSVYVVPLSRAQKEAFRPRLNSEHSDWRWFDVEHARMLPNLHPTVNLVLTNSFYSSQLRAALASANAALSGRSTC